MAVRSAATVMRMKQSIICFSRSPFHVSCGELCSWHTISYHLLVSLMFGNWLRGVTRQLNAQIGVGVCALCWIIWNSRNDIVFNKKKRVSNFLQVIHMATH